jgi:tellurite resistance protein TerC
VDQLELWVGFSIAVVALLVADLTIFHRKGWIVRIKQALLLSGFWILLALAFNAGVYFWQGGEAAAAFFTGYLIELFLSIDNVFVFLLIFSYFKVPPEFQHRVLFWGILGAIIMRLVFIVAGVALIHRFHWVSYIFGAFLVVTGVKMLVRRTAEVHPEKSRVVRFFKRSLTCTDGFGDGRFFVKHNGTICATDLFIVLVFVEMTDLIFAADSIPAILAITSDPFIVYTSNIFAILGLRSLYFALAGLMRLFRYLHYGLAVILTFVGAKMLLAELYKIPVFAALGVVVCVLAISVALSLWADRHNKLPASD